VLLLLVIGSRRQVKCRKNSSRRPTHKKLKELDDALAKKLKGICRGC